MGFAAPRKHQQSRHIQLFVRGCKLQEAQDMSAEKLRRGAEWNMLTDDQRMELWRTSGSQFGGFGTAYDDVLDAIIDSPKFRRDLAQADTPIVDIGQGDSRRTLDGTERFDWRKCVVWGVGIVFVMCVYGAAMRGLFAWWGGV